MKRFLGVLLAGAILGTTPAVAQGAPPVGVTGMALDGRAEISWQPVAGATAYNVYRGTTAAAVNTPVSLTGVPPPPMSAPASFIDTTAANGTTYFYGVRAVVGGVESANSRLVQVTPQARLCSGSNVVTQENCFPGVFSWKVPSDSTGIEGFATQQSINKGESIDFKIKAATPTVSIEIFRNGFYGGSGARLYTQMDNVPVASQPACSTNASTGLYDCSNWSVTQTITTTDDWPSGVYLARITRPDTFKASHILFVVRDDARQSDVLFGLPFTTYEAYNSYGGKSLYEHNSTGADTVSGDQRAVKVSFDRPFQNQFEGATHDWYTRTDYITVKWMESAGYDVSYDAVGDFETGGARIRDHRAYISGAHDEYQSAAMRSALESARDAGVDIFFTGANELFWKVRFEAGASGVQNRVLVCYKTSQSGGPDPSGIPTGTWRDPAGANKPENALSGVQFIGQKPFGYFPLRVSAAQGQDRVWRNTGLDTQATGASTNVGNSLVGWEWDARVANGAEPPGVVTLAASPVDGDILQDAGGVYAPGTAVAHMVKKQWPSGSLVVDTGTNQWNLGLGINAEGVGEPDRRIQQATTNILSDMGATPETPASDIVLDNTTSPPTVTQKTPASGATGVDPSTAVQATFSRAMDPATINTSSFTLKRPDGTTVPASVTYDSLSFTATLTPTLPLALQTTYTAQLASTIKSANNVGIGAAQVWSFATRAPDSTPPVVSVTAPASGATVGGTVNLTANATDNSAVAGVQFRVDSTNVGSQDTTAPYSISWDARTFSAGSHQIRAVATDTSGNTTTSAAIPVTVDNTGLVAAYGFEEPSGITATDSSGQANNGTINGPTRTTDGRFGSALAFDGSNDEVTVADSASLDLTTAMTLEAWVRPSGGSGWQTALMKETSNGLAYGLYASSDTNRPSAHVNTTREFDTRGPAALPAGTWTHLAATYDGANLRLYINGALANSIAVTGSMATSTNPLRMGGNAIWGEHYGGLIDEVRVYRRTLSAAEITTDMNTAVAGGAAPPGPDTIGQFTAPIEWPLVPVHIASLSNGKVAVWDGFDAAVNSERVWDPATGNFDPVPTGRNLFCAGHVTLPDGRLFVAGGHIAAYEGTKDTNIFNPTTRTWFRAADMTRARWYPTVTTLPDGRILTLSGRQRDAQRHGPAGADQNASETLPEIYNVTTNSWSSLTAAQRRMPLYPFMFVLPDGRVFDAGPDTTTRTLNTTTGQWTTWAPRRSTVTAR